jgi:hypothetical protein
MIVPVRIPWYRRLTGCWPERVRGNYGRCESGLRPYKILHERFNPENIYLYRWRIWPWVRWLTLGLVTANLHRILRPDDDPDPHDHPWLFWFGVILEGGYQEEGSWIFRDSGPPLVSRPYRHPGHWFFYGRHLHRIDRLVTGWDHRPCSESWSLVFMGPKVREWGFVDRVKGCWVQWSSYIHRGDRC